MNARVHIYRTIGAKWWKSYLWYIIQYEQVSLYLFHFSIHPIEHENGDYYFGLNVDIYGNWMSSVLSRPMISARWVLADGQQNVPKSSSTILNQANPKTWEFSGRSAQNLNVEYNLNDWENQIEIKNINEYDIFVVRVFNSFHTFHVEN